MRLVGQGMEEEKDKRRKKKINGRVGVLNIKREWNTKIIWGNPTRIKIRKVEGKGRTRMGEGEGEQCVMPSEKAGQAFECVQ